MMSRPPSAFLRLFLMAAAMLLAAGSMSLRAETTREKVRIVTGESELAAVLYRPNGAGPFRPSWRCMAVGACSIMTGNRQPAMMTGGVIWQGRVSSC